MPTQNCNNCTIIITITRKNDYDYVLHVTKHGNFCENVFWIPIREAQQIASGWN